MNLRGAYVNEMVEKLLIILNSKKKWVAVVAVNRPKTKESCSFRTQAEGHSQNWMKRRASASLTSSDHLQKQ